MVPLPQGDTEVPGRRNGRMDMYCTYMRGSTSAVRILTICAGSVHSTRSGGEPHPSRQVASARLGKRGAYHAKRLKYAWRCST